MAVYVYERLVNVNVKVEERDHGKRMEELVGAFAGRGEKVGF